MAPAAAAALLGASLARELEACGLLSALDDGTVFANAQVWVADREAAPAVVVLTDFPSARPSPGLGEPVMSFFRRFSPGSAATDADPTGT